MERLETHPELNPDTPARKYIPRGEDSERDRRADEVTEAIQSFYRRSGEQAFALLFDGEGRERPGLIGTAIVDASGKPTGYELTSYTYNYGEEGLRPAYKWALVITESGPMFDQATRNRDLAELADQIRSDHPKLVDPAVLLERAEKPEVSVLDLQRMYDHSPE